MERPIDKRRTTAGLFNNFCCQPSGSDFPDTQLGPVPVSNFIDVSNALDGSLEHSKERSFQISSSCGWSDNLGISLPLDVLAG